MYLPTVLLIILLASITLNDAAEENKINLKSKTLEDSKRQANASRSDPMKAEIKKYLSECGGESSDDENSDSSRYPRTGQKYGNNQDDNYGRRDDDNQYGQSSHGHHQGGNNRQNNGDNDRYGGGGQDSYNRNNGRDSNRNNRGDSSSRNNGRESMNRNFGGDSSSNRNYGGHSSGRDYGGESSNRNYGRDSSRNSGGYDRSGQGHGGYDRSGQRNGNDENDSYGSRNYDGYDSRNRESSGGSGRYGSGSDRHGYSGGYLRSKRSDNMECISQCVFGYLEVLDDNRSPSESALLKWIQDNLPNDAKRVKAVRETRRCFARLVSSDTSDGCDFSKALSNCMRLGIEN